MSKEDVKKWIYRMVEEGAEEVFHILEKISCMDENVEKIGVFIETCKEIEKMEYNVER